VARTFRTTAFPKWQPMTMPAQNQSHSVQATIIRLIDEEPWTRSVVVLWPVSWRRYRAVRLPPWHRPSRPAAVLTEVERIRRWRSTASPEDSNSQRDSTAPRRNNTFCHHSIAQTCQADSSPIRRLLPQTCIERASWTSSSCACASWPRSKVGQARVRRQGPGRLGGNGRMSA
jgi:hypothetical protein